jgi:glycerol-3-phosphate dehydrogenase
MVDVAILGGGVVGCAIARELSRYLLDTVVIEKEVEVGFGTSKTNSGIIHAGHHAAPDTLKGSLVVRGNERFDELHEELGFAFRRIGELVVAQGKEELPVLDALLRQGEEKGVPGLEIWGRRHQSLRVRLRAHRERRGQRRRAAGRQSGGGHRRP